MKKLKFIFTLVLLSTSFGRAQSLQWEIIGEMLYPVSSASALVFDNNAYVFGGYADSTQTDVEWIQKYVFQTSKWWLTGSLQSSRKNLVAELYKDSVLICGGAYDSRQGTNDLERWFVYGSLTELYDFNEYFDRIHGAGIIIGDSLHLIGGNKHMGGDGFNQPYIVKYNIPEKKFTYVNFSLYEGQRQPEQQMLSAIGPDIFIFGGVFNGVQNLIFKFNTETNAFDQLSTRLMQQRAGGIAIKADDGRIYIIGGYDESNEPISTTEIFSFNGSEYIIENGPELNIARKNLTGVYYNDKIYIFGGQDDKNSVVPEIEALDINGTTGIDDQFNPIVNALTLYQNFPNPFNPATKISFELKKDENISLDIYTVTGRFVTNLINESLKSGNHEIFWDGKDNYGNPLPSGVYLYRLTSGFISQTRKMLLLK